MMLALFALALQPPGEDYAVLPTSPFSEGDLALFITFVIILAAVFSFDMIRTWWETNQWKREGRRKRPKL